MTIVLTRKPKGIKFGFAITKRKSQTTDADANPKMEEIGTIERMPSSFMNGMDFNEFEAKTKCAKRRRPNVFGW